MDRPIFYSGQIPRSVDVLLASKSAMVGHGFLIEDLLGGATQVGGFTCSPTGPPSLNVSVGPGRIYSLQNIDNSAYGAIALDITHQIMKQGILLDAATLGCAAPSTGGQSINYLIEVAYQDNDTNSTVLSYYNSANPQQALSGVGNNGATQATLRQGLAVVQAKAGIAATTGTQTTPAADSGYTGLWVVTVANGQTTITSGNISQYANAPFLNSIAAQSGYFTLTGAGFAATVPSVTAFWSLIGNKATVYVPGAMNGISNGATFSASSLPTIIQPPTLTQQVPIAIIQDNGAYRSGGYVQVNAGSGVVQFGYLPTNNLSSWFTSGVKGAAGNFEFLVE